MVRSSKDLGNAFEARVAKYFDGLVYTGQDGDVVIPGTPYTLECKFTKNLENFKIRDWHNQIREYEQRNVDRCYPLVYSGGRSFQNARIWVSLPGEEFKRLIQLVYRGGIDKVAMVAQLKEMIAILERE